jgi:hypothetical protein
VRQKSLTLSKIDQFEAFTLELAKTSRRAANLVSFLTFGEFRFSEVRNITWGDCNFEKNEITVRGDPETGTKNWSIRRVPMISEMRGE